MNAKELWDEFEAKQEIDNSPRNKARSLVNAYARATGKGHSLVWRTAYIKLEDAIGLRVDTLDMVEAAGQMEDLVKIVRQMIKAINSNDPGA